MCEPVFFHTHSPGYAPLPEIATREFDNRRTTEIELKASVDYVTQGSGVKYNHYSELFCRTYSM